MGGAERAVGLTGGGGGQRAGGLTRGARCGLQAGMVLVIRYEGPKGGPGMPEMLTPTSAIMGAGLPPTPPHPLYTLDPTP